jgi:hypothetical protein
MIIGVTKVNNGVGATSLAVALASALATRHNEVYLVDADYRNPQLSQAYFSENDAGWLTAGYETIRQKARLPPWKCLDMRVRMAHLEYKIVSGLDAHYAYTGRCRPPPVASSLLDALYASLFAFLWRLRSRIVVVDLGFTSLTHLEDFARHFTLVYVDDSRFQRPTEAQATIARMAHYIVVNKAPKVLGASVAVPYSQQPQAVLQEAANRLLMMMAV